MTVWLRRYTQRGGETFWQLVRGMSNDDAGPTAACSLQHAKSSPFVWSRFTSPHGVGYPGICQRRIATRTKNCSSVEYFPSSSL